MAMDEAKRCGAVTIAFTGRGGKLKQIADYSLCVPSDDVARIQEIHIMAGHIICYLVEESMFGQDKITGAVFIDRDGTIAKDVQYCSCPNDFELVSDAGKSIKLLNEAWLKVILITNQSGIGRGYFSEETLEKIHKKMTDDLVNYGAHVDAVYYCPHKPADNCDCRKPKSGLIIKAARDHNIDLASSYMVGDKMHDIMAGKNAGCRTILIQSSNEDVFNDIYCVPDITVGSFHQAVQYILNAKDSLKK
jgi:histidinol-phosphate phosphatase family protein